MIKTSEGHDMEANTSTEPDNNPLHEAEIGRAHV